LRYVVPDRLDHRLGQLLQIVLEGVGLHQDRLSPHIGGGNLLDLFSKRLHLFPGLLVEVHFQRYLLVPLLQGPVFKEVVDSLQALEATRVVLTTLDRALEFAKDGFMVALVLPVFLERLPYLAKDRLLGKLLASEEQRVQLP